MTLTVRRRDRLEVSKLGALGQHEQARRPPPPRQCTRIERAGDHKAQPWATSFELVRVEDHKDGLADGSLCVTKSRPLRLLSARMNRAVVETLPAIIPGGFHETG